MYRTLVAPISSQVEVTWGCNNRCPHCYNTWATQKRSTLPHLTETTICLIVDELARNEVFDVTFTGGEPLCFPSILLAGVRKAIERGLEVNLNSNVTLLNAGLANELRALGVKSILISLAGPSSAIHDAVVGRKGAFEETVTGIRMATNAGLRVAANMVTTKANEGFVLQTGRLAHQLGAKSFGATRTTAPGNFPAFESKFKVSRETVKAHLSQLIELSKETGIQVDVFEHYPLCLLGDLKTYARMARRKCTAGVATVAIGSDGSVRPCTHNEKSYGSVFLPNGLSMAWAKMTEWRDGSLIPEKCRACKYLMACSGGCRMDALSYGDIAGMDSYATGEQDVRPVAVTNYDEQLPQNFMLSVPLKVRKESFGGLVKPSRGSPTLLDEEGFAIIKKLLGSPEKLTTAKLVSDYGLKPTEVNDFAKDLLAKKVFVEM